MKFLCSLAKSLYKVILAIYTIQFVFIRDYGVNFDVMKTGFFRPACECAGFYRVYSARRFLSFIISDEKSKVVKKRMKNCPLKIVPNQLGCAIPLAAHDLFRNYEC